jgi:hypothetical protein
MIIISFFTPDIFQYAVRHVFTSEVLIKLGNASAQIRNKLKELLPLPGDQVIDLRITTLLYETESFSI